jgi:hypothetical protein
MHVDIIESTRDDMAIFMWTKPTLAYALSLARSLSRSNPQIPLLTTEPQCGNVGAELSSKTRHRPKSSTYKVCNDVVAARKLEP